MDLIIVESPSKAKTIEKYLKSLDGDFKVDASAGHIRDLPEKRLGVKINEDFEPSYEIYPAKKDVIKRLKSEAKNADKIYLATDPDREGEAISWHLQHVLELDKDEPNRIEFNEISPKAVQAALRHPRTINYNLVDAQQARRVLDRLVGYKLSPLLTKRIECDGNLSAGRVQSVALKMVVDREREIQAFKPQEYWNVTAELQDKIKQYPSFKALLAKKSGKKYQPKSEGETKAVEEILRAGEFTVTSVKKTVTKTHAPAPFTTSSLQQDASSKFSIPSPEVMQIAQHLYEGIDTPEGHVAFVTYIRTDSTRISAEAQAAALEFIENNYGKEYVPDKPNVYKTKKSAQDAHEAIRPISLERTPQSVKNILDRKHYNVYKLIYDRFVASQMSEAKYNSMQIELDNSGYGFKASGRTLLFAGYTKAYEDVKLEKNDKEDEEEGKLLPDLNEGDKVDLISLISKQMFTKPPTRYTDATLVKAMDDKGIGRPSTYASIIAVLTKRKYVEKEGKYMIPTPVAYEICDLLVKYFSDIMDIKFTSDMEEKLDKIEEGGVNWKDILREFYPPFEKKLVFATQDGDEMTEEKCSKCGSPMIRRRGRYGYYLACSNYPACSNIIGDEKEQVSEIRCPKCGANMVTKSGKFGKFLACPNYPECNSILPFETQVSDEICEKCNSSMFITKGKYGKYLLCGNCGEKRALGDKVEVNVIVEGTLCPKCKKPLKRMKSKHGKIYFGCSGYPDCKFMSWDETTGETCPKCQEGYLVKKNGKIRCSECDYVQETAEENK